MSFEAIIDKHELSSYEKFIYLRKQLFGAARKLVDSLEFSEHSYDVAKELLIKAFDCGLSNKFNAILKLTQLKLDQCKEPFSFIGDMKMIVSEFKSLSIYCIPVEI